MALLAATLSPSNIRIRLLKVKACQLHTRSSLHVHCQKFPFRCSGKLPKMALSDDANKMKKKINTIKERLFETVPLSTKDFQWKKAEEILLQRVLFIGQKALKWFLFALFIFNSLSDVIFSFTINKELMIPVGLFVGCMIGDFFNETSQELFSNSEEVGLRWHLVAIGCFFILVKLLSTYFAPTGRVLLLHVCNGGLLQILWLWKNLVERGDVGIGEDYPLIR